MYRQTINMDYTMKYLAIIVLLALTAGCATTEETQKVRVTEESCKEMGGIIIQTDIQSPLRCLSGSRPYLIASN